MSMGFLPPSLGARVPGAIPNFCGIFPFKPRPSKPKCRCELIQVEDPKATKLLWPTNRFPIHFAHSPGGGVLGGPKEGPLDLVDEFESTWRGSKGGQVVYCLGGDDRLDKGGPAGRSNKSPIPSGQLAGVFFLKVLKINPL